MNGYSTASTKVSSNSIKYRYYPQNICIFSLTYLVEADRSRKYSMKNSVKRKSQFIQPRNMPNSSENLSYGRFTQNIVYNDLSPQAVYKCKKIEGGPTQFSIVNNQYININYISNEEKSHFNNLNSPKKLRKNLTKPIYSFPNGQRFDHFQNFAPEVRPFKKAKNYPKSVAYTDEGNTYILVIKLLVRNTQLKFKIGRYDDVFLSVRNFCEQNYIEEELVRPIVMSIMKSLNRISSVYSGKVEKSSGHYLLDIKDIWERTDFSDDISLEKEDAMLEHNITSISEFSPEENSDFYKMNNSF